jgi:hypothetical protein
MILILANAESKELPLKHLLLINGIPLITRTLDQLHSMTGERVYVACHDERLMDACPVGFCMIPMMEKTSCVCDTLLRCLPFALGHECLKVICGDVYWTGTALNALVMHWNPGITFFTDTKDIFGLNVSNSFLYVLKKAIEKALAADPMVGNLWAIKNNLRNTQTELVKDSTQDFDTKEDYDRFVAGHSKNLLYTSKYVRPFVDPVDEALFGGSGWKD